MGQRINVYQEGHGALKAISDLGTYLAKSSVEKSLLNLICYRVSQINGCAPCLDMHAKDLLVEGESGQRLFVLSAWRETPFYSDRERAALAWAESVTSIAGGEVSDDVYEAARKEFSDEELIDLTVAVTTVNTYNRLNIAFRIQAGAYQPARELQEN